MLYVHNDVAYSNIKEVAWTSMHENCEEPAQFVHSIFVNCEIIMTPGFLCPNHFAKN